MTYPDETVMAASERLKELADQADDQIAAMEREDRLWEMGETKLEEEPKRWLTATKL